MLEFKVNDYITLKLENKKTEIYIKDKKFIQCKFLLVDIPVKEYKSLGNELSIDNAEINLSRSLEFKNAMEYDFSPEVEFWAHCSNLQVWSENNYNTRLLHRNIAFSLLKKLTDVGDQVAIKVFKEQIGSRVEEGDLKVVLYLIEEGYLNYLSREELELFFYYSNPELKRNIQAAFENSNTQRELAMSVLKGLAELGDSSAKKKSIELFQQILKVENLDEYSLLVIKEYYKYLDRKLVLSTLLEDSDAEAILALDKLIGKRWEDFKSDMSDEEQENYPESFFREHLFLKPSGLIIEPEEERENYSFVIKNRRIIDINFRSDSDFKLLNFPKPLLNLTMIERLDLSFNRLDKLPINISRLEKLTELNLENNYRIESLPDSIGELKLLRSLDLTMNRLRRLPENIGKLKSLKELRLDNNKLTHLPEDLSGLKALEYLSLFYNNLEELPHSVGELEKLKYLTITGNRSIRLPETILDITSLESVNISNYQEKLKVIQKMKKKGIFISSI
jgi:hypothetical protein